VCHGAAAFLILTFLPQTDPVLELDSGLDHVGSVDEQEAFFGGTDRQQAA
jgi:hypothetical protein